MSGVVTDSLESAEDNDNLLENGGCVTRYDWWRMQIQDTSNYNKWNLHRNKPYFI